MNTFQSHGSIKQNDGKRVAHHGLLCHSRIITAISMLLLLFFMTDCSKKNKAPSNDAQPTVADADVKANNDVKSNEQDAAIPAAPEPNANAADTDTEMDLATRMNKELLKSIVEVVKGRGKAVVAAIKDKVKGKKTEDDDDEEDGEEDNSESKFSVLKDGLLPCLKDKDKCEEILEDAYQESIVIFKRSIVAIMLLMNDERVDPQALKQVIHKLIEIGDDGKVTLGLEIMDAVCKVSRTCRKISKHLKSASAAKGISKEAVVKLLLIWYYRLFPDAGENLWKQYNPNHPWNYYLTLADQYIGTKTLEDLIQ